MENSTSTYGLVPCMNCGTQYQHDHQWYTCTFCGFRCCASCFGSHSGPYSGGGSKCSKCVNGSLVQK